MSETENEEYIPVVEKQSIIASKPGQDEKPFQLVFVKPRICWRSNYAYYLSQVKISGSLRPLIGRYVGDNSDQFQVYSYETQEWEDKNFWDYSEPVVDANGNEVKNARGKTRRAKYFSELHEYRLQFKEPVAITYYNRELKQNCTETATLFNVRLSKSLSEKLQEQVNDPRSPEGSYFCIEHDSTKAPADQYKVRFHSSPN